MTNEHSCSAEVSDEGVGRHSHAPVIKPPKRIPNAPGPFKARMRSFLQLLGAVFVGLFGIYAYQTTIPPHEKDADLWRQECQQLTPSDHAAQLACARMYQRMTQEGQGGYSPTATKASAVQTPLPRRRQLRCARPLRRRSRGSAPDCGGRLSIRVRSAYSPHRGSAVKVGPSSGEICLGMAGPQSLVRARLIIAWRHMRNVFEVLHLEPRQAVRPSNETLTPCAVDRVRTAQEPFLQT
jgi:hypothetical protein